MKKAEKLKVEHLTTPLQGDITRGLPLEFRNFDAIFCMQSFHTYGTKSGILNYLATLLKKDGKICIAQTYFDKEFEKLPDIFKKTTGWNAEYGKYHSPNWWRNLFEANGNFEVERCEEISGGKIMWEDNVLYYGNRADWSSEYLEKSGWLIKQIIWSRTNSPSLTHFMLTANRN